MEQTMKAKSCEIQRVDTLGRTWSLDRRIPIALLIVAAIQLLGFAWFAIAPLPDRHYQGGSDVSSGTEAGNVRGNRAGISVALSRAEDTLEKSHAALIRIEWKLQRPADERR